MNLSPVVKGELNRARMSVCCTQWPPYVMMDVSCFIRSLAVCGREVCARTSEHKFEPGLAIVRARFFDWGGQGS